MTAARRWLFHFFAPKLTRGCAKGSAAPQGGVEATVRNATTGAQADSSIEDMTDMIESSQSFALNADVFETGADMWQILSTIKRD